MDSSFYHNGGMKFPVNVGAYGLTRRQFKISFLAAIGVSRVSTRVGLRPRLSAPAMAPSNRRPEMHERDEISRVDVGKLDPCSWLNGSRTSILGKAC